MDNLPGKRRFIFWRFAFFFGPTFFLFLLALAVVLALEFTPLKENFPRAHLLPILLCGVPLVFTLLAGVIGGMFFRRIGRPLADVMAAADSVAEGDLSVRVREDRPGEMGRLARSFNRMAAELERAEGQRRNLTADVAHELRTPLHIIQGNLEGILDGVYEPTKDHITATLEETRLLARLVEDLQTLSLAEAGQLPLYKVDFPAADLLADVVTSFAGQAAESGIGLEVDAANDGRDLTLHADPDRLDQVLSNLVANALRHTPSGGRVTLRASLSDGQVGGGSRYGFRYASLLNPTRPAPPYRDHSFEAVILSVEDTGEGIPPEDLPYIFDRFWRGDKSRTRGAGTGSGLGLAIARQLVEAHGGRIWAESESGEGTKIFIALPSDGVK
jgi:two-component system OmpR family sensor kinase/two-component system sensor histidine kinase BaeS